MLATIQIAEIENGFIVIAPPQHCNQALVGSGMYPPTGKHYPTMDELAADALNFIAVAVDAARKQAQQQAAEIEERMAQRNLDLEGRGAAAQRDSRGFDYGRQI